ncbi:hypothetical protein AK830_g10546 [Neonectria ditissima]|uniref:Nephrocystin 3-like N-terminal domain-containing protein n=1 Tax=Neonectria ditissima TaxID=78410 RepID=A0A0P7B5Y2_9HYPO|nr:hypothetical protein AK830_g10546 [Neonectria ditissima]
MAEVVGIVSGVAGLVAFAAEITKLSYSLISDVKNASQNQKLYLQEVSALTDVLFRADSAASEAESLGLSSLRPTSLSGTLITDCNEQLSRICDDLAVGIKRSKWLFQEKELKKRIDSLRGFHTVFLDYLSTHTLSVATETYRKVNEHGQRDQRDKLLKWLKPAEESSKPTPIPTPGTGQWFLDCEQYQNWRHGEQSTLWCYGAPGSGKSILASIVMKDLENSESRRLCVASYFCDYAIRKQQNTLSILRSILHRLINQVEEGVISTLIEFQSEAKGEPDVKIISDMIVTSCRLGPPMYLILDAPDELDAPKEIMALLQKFSGAGCKILVTTRDTPDLRNALSTASSMELRAVEKDVLLFLDYRFREEGHDNIACRGLDLIQGIVEKANGMSVKPIFTDRHMANACYRFLLAKILADKLLDMTTLAQMRKSLKKMPTTITEAFESSVKRIDAQPRARRDLAYRVIAWITQSQRRLKADELVHALAVEEDSDEFDEDNIPDVQLTLRVCVGLVTKEATDGSIGMVHTTAYEFFRSRGPQDIRRDIAATCLTYLTLPPFTSGPCMNLDEMALRIQQRPFMVYASKFWGDYIDTAEVEGELAPLVDSLLNSPKLRLSSFQALHHRPEIREKYLAAESLATIPTGQKPLHIAAYWNLVGTTRRLLQDGQDVSARDSQQWTPLHWAGSRESLASIDCLIAAGADPNAQDSQGWTPLFWLAVRNNEEGLRMILSKGASHLVCDIHGWTALTWAVSARRRNAVQILMEHHEAHLSRLENEPKPMVRDLTYNTAVEYSDHLKANTAIEVAAENGDVGMFNMLLNLKDGKEVDFKQIWSMGRFDVPVSNVWRTLDKAERHIGVESYIDYAFSNDDAMPADSWKTKLLHGAIRDDQYMAARALIELGADVNCSKLSKNSHPRRSALHAAAYRKDARYARLLLDNGADTAARDHYGQTPLHQAVVNGFVDTASELLEGKSNVNERVQKSGRVEKRLKEKTALIMACGLGSYSSQQRTAASDTVLSKMVSLLISHNVDVNMQDAEGMSALHHAAKAGHLDVIQQLIRAEADLSARDNKMRVPLHYGVQSADLDVIECLVAAGANLQSVDDDGKHMIHHLADSKKDMSGSTEDVRKLLSLLIQDNDPESLNVQWTSKTRSGKLDIHTPLSVATQLHNWTLVELLHELGGTFPPNYDLQQHLSCAVESLRLQAVKVLLEHGVKVEGDIFSLRRYGLDNMASCSAFPWNKVVESLDSFTEILSALIEAKLDINEEHHEAKTILHVVAGVVDSGDLVQLLLDFGADPRKATVGGLDAFVVSAVGANYKSLKVLLNYAAKTPVENHWTGSIEAAQSDNDALLRLLRALSHHGLLEDRKGVDSQIETDKCTLLWLSAWLGNERMVKVLLSLGADAETMDEAGWRPLHLAAFEGREEAARTLLLHGADASAVTKRWPTYYHMDRPSGYTSFCRHFEGADAWQGTPLHLASMKGFPAIVELLISHGADPKALVQGKHETPGEGPTALHMALDTGRFYGRRATPLGEDKLRIAEMLVENGADVATAADHIVLRDMARFEHHQGLWENLREGISEKGYRAS